jgi:hypothetical protein
MEGLLRVQRPTQAVQQLEQARIDRLHVARAVVAQVVVDLRE